MCEPEVPELNFGGRLELFFGLNCKMKASNTKSASEGAVRTPS